MSSGCHLDVIWWNWKVKWSVKSSFSWAFSHFSMYSHDTHSFSLSFVDKARFSWKTVVLVLLWSSCFLVITSVNCTLHSHIVLRVVCCWGPSPCCVVTETRVIPERQTALCGKEARGVWGLEHDSTWWNHDGYWPWPAVLSQWLQKGKELHCLVSSRIRIDQWFDNVDHSETSDWQNQLGHVLEYRGLNRINELLR